MAPTPPLVLASIDSMRPVFLIVMGLALLVVTWRVTRGKPGGAAKTLRAGALLLAFGYSLIIPLYQARVLVPLDYMGSALDTDPRVIIGWHIAKLVAMNGGWLLFGLGLALQARVFEHFFSTPPTEKPLA